ncbi:carboxypeptidase-like regulatory domain-containing protein [Hymenobacter yonginensis]|uniref:Carboxypeptidase-like regulatory domain-containing protein n=1 Tax=Hymenobacter yonginensis TaxID=748197 RepID=A0ABY7PV83_9BACT|nr:carboxypeptidase-like regulatory domain-containing protein [Hymenobacter yonginensis]WBO86805.1 carboxypeptidase-like regulatory domain-containing protein [Hymenobacter yonginensis]
MKNSLPLLLLLLLLLVFRGAAAQSTTVSGIVRDKASRLALPGVTVLEKGTTNGASTDAQGRFTLAVSGHAPRLFVSSIGYVFQEISLAGRPDSVTVWLEADAKALSEVVVTGHAPSGTSHISAAVSTVKGAAPGIRIRGLSTLAAPSRAELSTRSKRETSSSGLKTSAGVLTAGEVNDFGKWHLWPDIAQQELSRWGEQWRIRPLERYTAQLLTEDGYPVVGAAVQLKDQRDLLLWQARTDNTGRCELWSNLFTAGPAAGPGQVASLQALVDGQTYTVRQPTRFQQGLNSIRVPRPCRTPAVVDVAFVVDATGSMGDEIRYLQAELEDVIGQVRDSLAGVTLNVGSVFYRDAGDEYLTRQTNLSANLSQTLDFLRAQQAGGGGDFPEAVDQALDVAVNELAWAPEARARLLFLILDAPPHENPQVLASLQRSVLKAAAQGIRLIPVAASGIDKSTEYLLRALALATNGTYVFLTDDSGVGNPHLKPTTDRFEVEQLNALLVKIIGRYAATTDCQVPAATAGRRPGTLSGRYTAARYTAARDSTAAPATRPGRRYAWSCYPNPTADVLHVELEGDVQELFVADAAGKVLLRAAPVRHQAALRVDHLPTGVYFLTFFTGLGWEKTRFLVRR